MKILEILKQTYTCEYFLWNKCVQKITLIMGYLSLWHLHWISGLYSNWKLYNFCIVVKKCLRICWTLCGLMEFLVLNIEGHSRRYPK